jgi:hypothetical protein
MACQNQRIDWGIAIPLVLFCIFSALFSIFCDHLAARFRNKIRNAQITEELVGGCQGFSVSKKAANPSVAETSESANAEDKKTN